MLVFIYARALSLSHVQTYTHTHRPFAEMGEVLPRMPFAVLRNFWKDQCKTTPEKPFDCRVMKMAWRGIVGLTEITDFKYHAGTSDSPLRIVYCMWKCRASFSSDKYRVMMALLIDADNKEVWSIEWAVCGCINGSAHKCHHAASLALIVMLLPRVENGRKEEPSPTAQLCLWIQRQVHDRRLVTTPLRLLESHSTLNFGERGKGVSRGKQLRPEAARIAQSGYFNTEGPHTQLTSSLRANCDAFFHLCDFIVARQNVIKASKAGTRKRPLEDTG